MPVLGTLMIAARVAAGVHWPSDVLGGAFLGLLVAGTFTFVQCRVRIPSGLAEKERRGPPRGQEKPPSSGK